MLYQFYVIKDAAGRYLSRTGDWTTSVLKAHQLPTIGFAMELCVGPGETVHFVVITEVEVA